MSRLSISARVLAALLLTASCSGSSDGPTTPAPSPVGSLTTFFPTRTGPWETIQPAAIGWDSTALRAALDWAGTQRSTAVVILWRGRIVAERYWGGWTADTDSIIASAGKSVLSTMVGQLNASGRLPLDDPATRWLGAGWSRSPATEARITIRDLLSMTSGLNDSLQQVVQPATRFYYNNPAYYQLFQVVQRVTGQDINTASRALLFDAIGMSSTWRLSFDTGEPGFILSATARDMARFGLLTLSKGRWNGTPVVSDSTWFDRALR
ncbi:serine hydrolase domain-containing protein, partial [Gemmatimonas sp.]|uniref:serine hydrolase domain-containing protein n=1 Tax=Gemmatimonas sp. TaxID=1962908 RepID=UPI00333FAC82